MWKFFKEYVIYWIPWLPLLYAMLSDIQSFVDFLLPIIYMIGITAGVSILRGLTIVLCESKYSFLRGIGFVFKLIIGFCFVIFFLYCIYAVVFEGVRLEGGFTPDRVMPGRYY